MKIELEPEEEAQEEAQKEARRVKILNGVCLGMNFLMTVLYVVYAWQIGIAGFLSLALGLLFAESGASAGDVICMLLPLFALAAILFGEFFRKKERFVCAFAVHLVPLGTFGIAWLFL